jgi:hypothetical protein
VDTSGSAYVTGLTTSQDFPVTFRAFQTAGGGTSTDAFVTKLDPSGAALVYSTYLGGILADSGASVAVDSSGRAYVAGSTYGSAFPLVDPIQPASGGFFDAFLAVLNDAGAVLEFSTYLGGSGNEKARGLVLDSLGNVYAAGETFSEDFPAARGLQPSYGGGAFDAFLAKVALGDSPVLYVSPTQLDFGEQLVGTVSPPQAVTLTNTGTAPLELSGVSVSGEFTQSNNCATSLDVNASCSVQISFTPQTTGERAGGLTVTNSSPAELRTAALAGAGTDFSIGGSHLEATVAAGETASFTLSATPAGGFHETVSLACSGAPKAASCLVSPALVAFDGASSVPVSVTVSTRSAPRHGRAGRLRLHADYWFFSRPGSSRRFCCARTCAASPDHSVPPGRARRWGWQAWRWCFSGRPAEAAEASHHPLRRCRKARRRGLTLSSSRAATTASAAPPRSS